MTEHTEFKNKKLANNQKLRGGYYTPKRLATYLVQRALRDQPSRILEPSCGDGNFIQAIADYSIKLPHSIKEVVAVEIDENEIKKAQNRFRDVNEFKIRWHQKDFFGIFDELGREKFDVVLGNPPFIRFQYFEDDKRKIAFSHLKNIGYKPTKLANVWSAFVQLSIELLNPGGRLAMVVPAELLQVNYAGELRERITKSFENITLIGFKKIVFPEIQQEILLLIADGKKDKVGKKSTIHTFECDDGEDLFKNGKSKEVFIHRPAKYFQSKLKWTSLFVSDKSFYTLNKINKTNNLTKLGKLAQVDVGIVTGRNDFFILKEKEKNEIKADEYFISIIGRTNYLKSIIFDKNDFENYTQKNPCYLLNLKDNDFHKFPSKLKEYIERGTKSKVNEGYKCSVRKRWYDVPSVYNPNAFLFRQIHNYPLLVINQAKITSTDTIHRVRINPEVDANKLAALFFNSLTLAHSEVIGRSYGGGVLELEPREAEDLLVPYDADFKVSHKTVDRLLRQGRYQEALNYVDDIVLIKGLGIKKSFVEDLRQTWIEMKNRRHSRKNTEKFD